MSSAARKPHVLLVTPFLPHPPVDGGKKRVHTLLKLLAPRVDFTLLSFINNPEDMWLAPYLKDYCRSVVPILLEQDRLPEREDFFLPQVVKSCYSTKMVHGLQKIITNDPPDLVHFEFIQMAYYSRYVKTLPVVLTEHDMSNISFFRSYFREMTGWRRWARIPEWGRLVKYQMDSCRAMDGIVTLTQEDTAKLQSYVPDAFLRCITTGVELERFPLTPSANGRADQQDVNLVYIGHYMHYPNEDAILYFCRKIFPLILKKCPVAKLWVVGSGPTEAVKKLGVHPRIEVTGTVKDVAPYVQKADVFVAPLRLGEGIKGKILEAMATGVPVVTTPTGAWGLQAKDGEHFLVARSPEDFAHKTVRLAFDHELRSKLIPRAREMVETLYDWKMLADRLGGFYEEVIARRV